MHKSSSQTFLYQYIYPFLFPIGVGVNMYILYGRGDEQSIRFAHATLIMFLCLSCFIIQMPLRLRKIETTETGLIVKGFRNKITIDYKNIEWLTRFDLTAPWFVTIKYRDPATSEAKKIAFIPNQKTKQLVCDDPMTIYIKEQIALHNPLYSIENTPSKVKNIIILAGLCVPVMLLFFYARNGFVNF